MSTLNASANTTFVASDMRVIKPKNIRRCRAILIHHPPLMRVVLGMKYAQTLLSVPNLRNRLTHECSIDEGVR